MDELTLPEVDILLATYNGVKHIKDQLNSILYQTNKNWRLIIRDDGSTDGTIDILYFYASLDPRIIICKDEKGNLGVFGNFMELITLSKSKYIMLADQDDIWMNNKVERSLAFIKNVEEKDAPILVFSNSILSNENLTKQYGLNYNLKEAPSLTNFLFYNAGYQGANMIFNKELKQMLFPVFGKSIVHDFHISLVALLLGKVYHISVPLMIYRRHTKSTTLQNINLKDRVVWVMNDRSTIHNVEMLKYFKLFINYHHNQLKTADKRVIGEYFKIISDKNSKLKKIKTVFLNDFNLRGSKLYLILKILILK